MRYRLLLLLFAACTTTPTTYSQGAPMPPRAPAFEPTWTAPHTTGQPGYVGDPATAPRSPHSRVLPETPETQRGPGIWAGDEPKTKRNPRAPPPGQLTAKLKASEECGQERAKVQKKVFGEAFRVLTFAERLCLNVKMDHLCTEAEEKAAQKYASLTKYDPRWRDRPSDLDSAAEFAFAVQWYCPKETETDRVKAYFEQGRREFYAITRIPQ